MTMAEVQEDRVATIKYKRDRVSEDEQEIAELEAERNKDVEAQREEEAEQELGAEEQTYKKDMVIYVATRKKFKMKINASYKSFKIR